MEHLIVWVRHVRNHRHWKYILKYHLLLSTTSLSYDPLLPLALLESKILKKGIRLDDSKSIWISDKVLGDYLQILKAL